MALVQQKERKEILDLMEGYSKNPSNSNKYYSSMQALIDNRISREINSVLDELIKKRVACDCPDGPVLSSCPLEGVKEAVSISVLETLKRKDGRKI